MSTESCSRENLKLSDYYPTECNFERPFTPQSHYTRLNTPCEDKGRKGKLKSRAKDINPFTFGEQHNNAMFIKKDSIAETKLEKKQSIQNIFRKFMTPDKKFAQKIKDFYIRKKCKIAKQAGMQTSRNLNLVKAYGTSKTKNKNQMKQKKIHKKLENLINKVSQMQRTEGNSECKLKIPNINRISSHFDKVFNTINDLDTKASSALENMFEFKKEEIQENEKDTQMIIKEYRRFRLSPDPKVMKMELRKDQRKAAAKR